jgi:hypothetical protein
VTRLRGLLHNVRLLRRRRPGPDCAAADPLGGEGIASLFAG